MSFRNSTVFVLATKTLPPGTVQICHIVILFISLLATTLPFCLADVIIYNIKTYSEALIAPSPLRRGKNPPCRPCLSEECKMGIIRASSATVASLYITFLAFVILCISNFVPANGPFEIDNFDYGIAFLLLSVSGLLSGFTSGDANDPFLRALLLCLCAMWGALGTFYITRDLTGPDLAPLSEALFPGYGAFFFIFLIFGFVCLQHQQFHTAVLALSLFLCCIFEIASLWRPVRMSVGSYYLLLGVMVLYMAVKMLVDKLQGKNYKQIDKRLPTENKYSNDYMAVGYAMDTVALTAFASHVTGITNIASNGFMWVGSAGIFQTICGLVAIRRKDPYYGTFFNLYGIFWCAVAFHLGLNYFSAAYDLPLLTVNIFFAVVFVLTSVIALTQELFHSIQNVLMAVFTISICVNGIQGHFLGGMGCVCFLFSLYGLAAHAGRLKQTRHKLPLGRRLFDRTQLKQYLTIRLSWCARFIYGKRQAGKNKSKFDHKLFSTNFSDMGYSKYINLDTIGFAVNAVASLSILWVPANFTLLTLPWVSIVGGVVQMMVGCVCFGRGLTFESCAFIVFGTMWLILGTARSLGTLALDNSVAMSVCSIAYMITGLLLIGLSLVISKAWFLVTFLFELIALAFLLNSLTVPSYASYEVIVVLPFAFVSLYCFLAAAFKSIWGRELLPTGTPIIQVSYLHSQGNRAFWAHAQKQSGVKGLQVSFSLLSLSLSK
ncbi:unnamed protein product [Acanthosepion pharaonis]|uniref:Uncharacterized protein n=1 Tax=Acanthosepion pharaonis TaxID=158019 RepID=A0A812BBI4_ACAPH|nr:unnamed protein product [Sepia pharaonis]